MRGCRLPAGWRPHQTRWDFWQRSARTSSAWSPASHAQRYRLAAVHRTALAALAACCHRACHTPHRQTKHAATCYGCVCPGNVLSRPPAAAARAQVLTRPAAAAVCHCTTLAQVSDRLRTTVRNNQQYVNPGANFMLLNGMLVEVKNFEIYSECSTAQHSRDMCCSCSCSCTTMVQQSTVYVTAVLLC